MDDLNRNPSSPDDGRATDGPPSQIPISNSLEETLVEASRREPDGSGPNGSEGEEPISAAPNSDAFMSNGLESGSPIDEKMEKVGLVGRSDDLLAVPSAPAVERDDDTDSDDGSGETETDDSESDESSSEDSDSSSSTSSDEEEEEEDEDGSKGDGGEGPEEVPVGSDDEEEVVRGPIKSKNELEVFPPVPQVGVSLEPHHQTFPVGMISSVLGNRVIVEGSGNHKPLSEGSILWITETRSPLGIIDEIFGPVKNPYYVVRYNSEKDVPVGIGEGIFVSYVIEFANYVLDKDLHKKGYDASGDNDEEISDGVEFSDDEKEAEYKRSLRQAKRGTDDRKIGNQGKDTRRKKTNFKGSGVQKGMMPRVPRGSEALKQPISSVRGPCMALSRACNSESGKSSSLQSAYACQKASPMKPMVPQSISLVGDLAIPSYQLSQQPNAILGHGVLCPQQPNAILGHGVSCPQQPNAILGHGVSCPQLPNAFLANGMPLQQQQQQQNALWSLAIATQQQLNAIFTLGMPLQQQQSAGMTGFQMNCLPSQQLGNEANLHQHQNQGLSYNQNRMPSQRQMSPMLGTLAMPWIGRSMNSSTGLMPPVLVGQAGIGQASSVYYTEQGISGLGNHQSHGQPFQATVQGGMDATVQFKPGSSSVHGRVSQQRRGGHSFR